MSEVTRADLIQIIRNIEARGSLAIAHKCRGWLEEIFRYASGMGKVQGNLAADLASVSLSKPAAKNNPYLKMDELPEFLANLSNYPGYTQTSLDIRLLLLTGVRTGELRHAEPNRITLIWKTPSGASLRIS